MTVPCVIVLTVTIALTALCITGHGFPSMHWDSRLPAEPAQIWSKVDYDPKLADSFFAVDQWTCRDECWHCATCRDGKPALILKDPCDALFPRSCWERAELICEDGCNECAICNNSLPVEKITAKCYSNSFGVEHPVLFCKARLLDVNNVVIELDCDSPFAEHLRIHVINGMFSCRYQAVYKSRGGGLIWTTKRHHLTLDRKVYRQGDVIKGRIGFECLQEPTDPGWIERWGSHQKTIRLYGVFQTTVR